MEQLEHDMLLLQGYVPANVQACRDYLAGKINQETMWRIINKNINLSRYMEIEGRADKQPRPKDLVKNHSDEYGHISWIDWREEEVHIFWYATKEMDVMDLSEFYDWSDRGNRRTWLLD